MDGTLLGDQVQLGLPIPEKPNEADWALEVSGTFAHELPDDLEENIVMSSCRAFQSAAPIQIARAAAIIKVNARQ